MRGRLPKLAHVILIDDGPPVAGTIRWPELMSRASDEFVIPPTSPDDHGAAAFHQRHHRPARRARSTSTTQSSPITRPVFMRSTCTMTTSSGAPPIPGWVTGTSYGIIAPLTHGVTNLVVEAEFDAQTWYGILARERVTRLVHRPDRDPHDDEARRGCRARLRSRRAALHGQRRRAAQSGGGGVGRRGLRPAVPRQLVADRDGRHHDRQLPRPAGQARLDGSAAAGRSRRRSSSVSRTGRSSSSISRWCRASWR